MQAVKDIDEAGLRRALPQQLALCEELLSELAAFPEAATFMHQWVRTDRPWVLLLLLAVVVLWLLFLRLVLLLLYVVLVFLMV